MLFCAQARPEAIAATTGEALAVRYGVDVQFAKYHHALALRRGSAG